MWKFTLVSFLNIQFFFPLLIKLMAGGGGRGVLDFQMEYVFVLVVFDSVVA